MKMKFDQFTEEVVNKIREFLPDSFAEASVELRTVLKNNDLKLTGLTIRNTDNGITPTIYLEQFFAKYQEGMDMGRILASIADIRMKHEVSEAFDVGQITDFDRVKDTIVPHLIGQESNATLLRERPHKILADLAVTYHIMLKQDFSGSASVPITYALMEGWGVDEDMLHELALRNMKILTPSTFQPMSEVLAELLGSDAEGVLPPLSPADEVMFVLSNSKRMFGAASLLDEEIMKTVIDRLGTEDFHILPSSVNDCIIVKGSPDMDVSVLRELVHSVNISDVQPDEVLSENVYCYSDKKGLYIAG